MKRYIKSTRSSDFLVEKETFRNYLKQYQEDLTDQDIEDMVNEAYPDEPRQAEQLLTDELRQQIYSEFEADEAEEICALIECGYSVDNAIQTVLFR
jgi:hypothetical protein